LADIVDVNVYLLIVQVSEAGVHRPHVAGIHGREEEGSYSIVLAGGYEDDQVCDTPLLFYEECEIDIVKLKAIIYIKSFK